MSIELIKRLQKILPDIELKKFYKEFFCVDGINKLEEYFDKLNSGSGFHFFSPPVISFPSNYINWFYYGYASKRKNFWGGL